MSNQQQQRPNSNQNLPATQPSKDYGPLMSNGVMVMPSAQHWAQIREMGNAAFKSGLLPSSVRNAEAASIIALKAWEIGIPMMQGYAQLYVLNGKVGMDAALMRSISQRNMKGLQFEILESTNAICKIKFTAPGKTPYTGAYTIEEARIAGLLAKDNWKHYPGDMLYNRCLARGLRRFCPEALGGVLYTIEELKDADAIETTGRTVGSEPPQPETATDQPPVGPSEPVAPIIEVAAVVVPPTTSTEPPLVSADRPFEQADLDTLKKTAERCGWKNDQVSQYMRIRYKAERLSNITRAQFAELLMTIGLVSFDDAVKEVLEPAAQPPAALEPWEQELANIPAIGSQSTIGGVEG